MKYGNDGSFNDPVVRCDSCNNLIQREAIQEKGLCPECGNRKVRNVQTFNSKELQQMKDWNIDPDFIGLFEEQS